ncbi:MAG: DegT/DnrJ/EryC1/StrS family aminotransferase [Magnetococcus sp. YQC-3]
MTGSSAPIEKIPLVDLGVQYQLLREEINAAIQAVLERGDFVLGREVALFEDEFARYCGVQHAVSCASGTDALHLACRVLGLGPGDEVIMPAMTFVATALGISLAGARPVLVDVDPRTALIDPERVKAAITPRTKAIIPVHLYGQCADMDPLLALARAHGLYVIEDAAQAHGAGYRGRRAGSMGDVGCFSFYPGKNLGAYGDGGLITTQNAETDEKLRLLRNWGSRQKYHHEEMGLNSRLDTVQAALLRVKLTRLEQWNDARRKAAAQYDALLEAVPGVEKTHYDPQAAYHLYVLRVAQRDAVCRALNEAGIGAGIHYPFAVHELKAYSWLGYAEGDFPVAAAWARRCLSLPIYPEISTPALERVVATLREVVSRQT